MRIRRGLATAFALILPSLASAATSSVKAQGPTSVADFLRTTTPTSKQEPDKSIRYSVAAIPHTRFTLVYLQGPTVCGSGGCTLLMLKSTKSSYQLVRTVQIVGLPIVNLGTKLGVGPTIGVWAHGGGVVHGGEVAITPADKRHSANPSLSKTTVPHGAGKLLIDENDQGVALFN